MNDSVPSQWRDFLLKDVTLVNLMMRRIYNVLIVANPYSAFMLEDDGRVEEKTFDEYVELGLCYPPTFAQVNTTEETARILQSTSIGLVICMPETVGNDAFAATHNTKGAFPDIHCVVLTPFSHGITRRMESGDLSVSGYVLCWLGDMNFIMSIIKLMEDKMSLEHDIIKGGVQMMLLVEDSTCFYSSILPNLYSYILEQNKRLSFETLNRHTVTLRVRGRPKVILARTYEKAMDYYNRFADNILGVTGDVRYPKGGVKDAEAGLKLLREIRKRDPYLPLIMKGSKLSNREKTERKGFRFVGKDSKVMGIDLRRIFEERMDFGDFIFRGPLTRQEIMRVYSLKELRDNVFKIPDDSFRFHVLHNHMNRWLSARSVFPISEFLKNITWDRLQDLQAHR